METSWGRVFVGMALSGLACGALGWRFGQSTPAPKAAASEAPDPSEPPSFARSINPRAVSHCPTPEAEECSPTNEVEPQARHAVADDNRDDIDPDPHEDYARYEDGPSPGAMDLETVTQLARERACMQPGTKGCTADFECCGASQCRPPAGQISGVFSCT